MANSSERALQSGDQTATSAAEASGVRDPRGMAEYCRELAERASNDQARRALLRMACFYHQRAFKGLGASTAAA